MIFSPPGKRINAYLKFGSAFSKSIVSMIEIHLQDALIRPDKKLSSSL